MYVYKEYCWKCLARTEPAVCAVCDDDDGRGPNQFRPDPEVEELGDFSEVPWPPRIIGIAGKARAGKDTIAETIIAEFGYRKYAFADPMKNALKDIFGWSEEHVNGELKEEVDPEFGFSPRAALQSFGQGLRDDLDPDVWVKAAKVGTQGADSFVVPDVRYENEASWIRELGGVIFHVFRRNRQEIREHETERGILVQPGDFVFLNNTSIQVLEVLVRHAMKGDDSCQV